MTLRPGPFSTRRKLPPAAHNLIHVASYLAAHSPHSAAWWCRSWCIRQSLWLQPESYSWLTPTWRQQKCWRSQPGKWRSQTRRRSPRRSGRKMEETQWAPWGYVAGMFRHLENPLVTKENTATVALTQEGTIQCMVSTVVNAFSCLYVSEVSQRKTTTMWSTRVKANEQNEQAK